MILKKNYKTAWRWKAFVPIIKKKVVIYQHITLKGIANAYKELV